MNPREFAFLLSKGEDYNTEFKENLSGIEKDIVAFSNAEGGVILIGVSDDKKVKGIEISNKIKAEIQSIARNCDLAIEVEISEHANVLIVNVPESLRKPHKCSHGFYIRIGPISQKLNVDEIRELFNKHGKLFFEERIDERFKVRGFTKSKFYDFLKKAGISRTLKANELLQNLGLANSKMQFKNAAILLFGKEPARFIPQGIITCVLYKGADKVFIIDRKDFASDIISNYNDAMAFLYKHLMLGYQIKGIGPRKNILEIPEDALKEAVVNAICHRDYGERGAVIQIDVFDDRVEISNPGGLIFKESDFGKKSVSRNPLIFGLLQRINLVEHVGSGIKRIREALALAGLPPPKFEFGMFFTIIFFRDKQKLIERVTNEVGVKVGVKVGVNEGRILAAIRENASITYRQISDKIGLSEKSVYKNIEKLKVKGLLRRVGPDKTGHWEVIQ